MLWSVMVNKKYIKPKVANDNRHDQFMWELLHTWLDFWLRSQHIAPDQWPYNRAIHYTYELQNRPWLDSGECTTDALTWLHLEARSMGFTTRLLTSEDLRADQASNPKLIL